MNKDEMIKDIRAIIDDRCEAELGQVHAESKGGKVTKTVSTSLIAKDIYNANYRKVGEDMVIIDRETWENTRKNYARLCKVFHEAKRETAREILKWIDEPFTEKEIRNLIAENFGIELE